MMLDERDRYIADNPEVLTMPLPEGWHRLDSMPVWRPIQLLQENGCTYTAAPSNAVFLTEKARHIGWMPAVPRDGA